MLCYSLRFRVPDVSCRTHVDAIGPSWFDGSSAASFSGSDANGAIGGSEGAPDFTATFGVTLDIEAERIDLSGKETDVARSCWGLFVVVGIMKEAKVKCCGDSQRVMSEKVLSAWAT